MLSWSRNVQWVGHCHFLQTAQQLSPPLPCWK